MSSQLPEREATYLRHLKEYSHADFDDLSLRYLQMLVRESKALEKSRVRFPLENTTGDISFHNTLEDWIGKDRADEKDWSDWTFGYVAKAMGVWVMIDIENGHYNHRGGRSVISYPLKE